jgi:hypothetical protein
MAFCTNEMDGIDGSLNEARWFYAPTGRKGKAQGKAKRRPGIRDAKIFASPERAERYHGEANARCTHNGRAPTWTSYPTHPGWRFALPWAISLSPVGAGDGDPSNDVRWRFVPTRSVGSMVH